MARLNNPLGSTDLHRTELDYLQRMVESGVTIAIPAAKHYCLTHKLDIPAWLAQASIDLECEYLRSDQAKGRGRTANPLAQHRQNMCHYQRWDAITEIVEKQSEFRRGLATLRTLPNVPSDFLKERVDLLRGVGSSLEDAYKCASIRLAKSESFGSPATMKASYLLVEREFRDPKTAIRYHLLDPRFTRKLY